MANQAYRGDLPRELTVVTIGSVATARIDRRGDPPGEPTVVSMRSVATARIDLSVPVDLDISICDDGEFRSWIDVTDRANSNHSSGQLNSVYMVDVDRAPAVIDVSHMPATSEEELRELDAILASMLVDRGP